MKISCDEFKAAMKLSKVQSIQTTSGKKAVLCTPIKGAEYSVPAAGDLNMMEAPSFIMTDDGTWVAVNTKLQIKTRGAEF